MDKESVSTITFKSNIQPITGSYREDKAFLASIHDVFALELLQKAGYSMTPIQTQEYQNASVHCSYAFEGDYPFGTIMDDEGNSRVVCKCTNVNCSLFSRCRPDFDSAELDISEENTKLFPYLQELDAIWEKLRLIDVSHQKGDALAVSKLYERSSHPKQEDLIVDEKLTNVTNTNQNGESVKLVELESVNTPDSEIESKEVEEETHAAKNASFSSFVDVVQNDIIVLPAEERTIVNAGPGTGKTWTLIEKIKYMITDLSIDPSEILVLCFSRAAVEVIRTRLEAAAQKDELPLNWHQLDVRTFDSFSTYLIAWVQENLPRLLPKYYSLEGQSYDDRIRTASEILKTNRELLTEYEHIIVDEVQDLVGVRANLVLSILGCLPSSCGFTLLGDSCQALYDYLAIDDSSVMSSELFYSKLFHEYSEANYFSLSHNYRQGDEFGELSIPYRKAILSGNADLRVEEAKKLDSSLVTSDINLKKITQSEIAALIKNGTLGILSRTNGQALQISSWLRAEGIPHAFQRPTQSQDLAMWIAKTIVNAETDVISKTEFCGLFAKFFPSKSVDAKRYWDALISTQIDQTKTHYEIEDLIKGLLQNARNPLLFEDPITCDTPITISNIHRAKGREFDSVLVLQDVLENMTDEEKDDLLEHKVCYVALTRPKKKIEKVVLKPQFIYISKDETRRCFKAGGFKNRRYVSHFEVGESSDFNSRTYASSNEIQEYIQKMKPDTRLKLIKCPEGTMSYVVYKIVPEDDEHTLLGYTTPWFARSLERAIQRIYENPHSIAYKYFPNTFGDVYLDGFTTCVSSSDKGIPGARKYGEMNIWFGLSISGFAQMEKDRY